MGIIKFIILDRIKHVFIVNVLIIVIAMTIVVDLMVTVCSKGRVVFIVILIMRDSRRRIFIVLIIIHSFRNAVVVNNAVPVSNFKAAHALLSSKGLHPINDIVGDRDHSNTGTGNVVAREKMQQLMPALLGRNMTQMNAANSPGLHRVVSGGFMRGLNIGTKGSLTFVIVKTSPSQDGIGAVVRRHTSLGRKDVQLVAA